MSERAFQEILMRHKHPEGRVNAILQDVQAEFRHIPEDAVKFFARELKMSEAEIYGVITFYHMFTLKPQGKYIVSVCQGTVCHVKGADRIRERLEDRLNVKAGETTENLQFTLQEVNCLGCCSVAPAMAVNGKAFGRLTPESAVKVIDAIEGGTDLDDIETA